jgi:sugar phosphate isomerase/epimerase
MLKPLVPVSTERAMLLCFNQVTAGVRPPVDIARDLGAVRAGGWEAVELWLRHWDAVFDGAGPGAARRMVDDAGLAVAGACAQPGVLFSEGEARRTYAAEFARRLEQCQALGAPHLVVTPGPGAVPETPSAAELARAADRLRAAADLAAGFGVRLGIEFLKGARLVSTLPTALDLARRAAHPNLGVVLDTFHLYAGASKLEDLALLDAPERLSFVHLNDVPGGTPRELWADSDRVLPGDGALPLDAIAGGIRASGYAGYASLELFSAPFAARWEADPVVAAGDALRRCAAWR